MKRPLATAALAALALCTGCAEPSADGARLEIAVAALELEGIGDACYDLRVFNEAAAAELVWERLGVCASRFGDAPSGAVSYVGPCDASADDDGDGVAENTVALTLAGLYDAPWTAGATALDDYKNPCPASAPCELRAACVEGGDTPVSFDLTVLRAARQGFFDVAVDFNDIFCSAKVDCGTDAAPRLLLHDATGERRRSVVIALACASTPTADDADTTLWLDDLTVTCVGDVPSSSVIGPIAGPGNLCAPGRADGAGPGPTDCASGVALPADGPLFQAAVHRGLEALPDVDKVYLNVVLGLEDGAPANTTCALDFAATADDAAAPTLPGGVVASDQVYPFVRFEVADLYACEGNHAVDAVGSDVATAYTRLGDAPRTFPHTFPSAPVTPDPEPASCAVGAPTCPFTSCYDHLVAAPGSADGWQVIDPDGAGPLTAVEVWCDMTTDGGGWTVVGRAFDVTYDPAPPAIGDGSAGTWATWAAHSWRSGDSYYLSLEAFEALTSGSPALIQRTRTSAGGVKREARWSRFRYDATLNQAWLGVCANVASSPCSSSYHWGHRGASPTGFFDGYRQPGGGVSDCNSDWGDRVWAYHNHAGCASDSGLFWFENTSAVPRPQDLGVYRQAEHENLIMVRALPPAAGTSCATILAGDPDASSGVYVIDADDAGPLAPVAVWCDMTPGDGGWTDGLIVDTDTPSATRTRLAGYTTFGVAGPPALGTAYGADLTGVTFSEVRIDNFAVGARVTRSAAAPGAWGGTAYTSDTGHPARRIDLAGGQQLRTGYYGNTDLATTINIPVCFVSTATNVGWVCDTDSGPIEGWVDASGGEVCGAGFYYGQKVWRDASATPVCRSYLGATPPAVYGLAVR